MKGRVLNSVMKFFLVVAMTFGAASAEIASHSHSIGLTNNVYKILLVGIKQHELAQQEMYLLNGKKPVEILMTNNWIDAVKKVDAREVIVKHNSGFAGLYKPNGDLVRPIMLADGSNPIQQQAKVGIYDTYPNSMLQNQMGYSTGGRIDAYAPQRYVSDRNDHKRLMAGWGYNSKYDHPPSKRSAVVNFLSFMPLDVTTPLNYVGQFGGSPSLSLAYASGVLPHVTGFLAKLKRAQAEGKDYDYYRRAQSVPEGIDRQPVLYYQGAKHEESNPITTDPNFVRYQKPPQAFQNQFPEYGMGYNSPQPQFGAGSGGM